MDLNKARKDATRVTLVGMWLDILLGIAKIVGGIMTQSYALITDGIHSFTDVITDIFVLIVARVSHAEPDAEHPYGHGRFETLGTIGMGVVFFTTAGIILFDSIQRLRVTQDLPLPALWGLGIALISVAAKEWIYHYTMRVAKRLNSSLLRANAWHSRSDAISSLAVFIGIAGAQQGYVWMDTVAAIFVALIIAKIGWNLCVDSLKELVDTAIPDNRRRQIEQCLLEIDGIKGITSLRSRLSGGKIMLEAQLLVNPRISVSEGHQLGEIAHKAVIGRFSDVGDIIVHIDPQAADHGEGSERTNTKLPERSELIHSIKQQWHSLVEDEQIANIDLHYFEHGIEIDLILQGEHISADIAEQLRGNLSTLEYIVELRIFYKFYDSENSSRPA